jgi:hypothetical protein
MGWSVDELRQTASLPYITIERVWARRRGELLQTEDHIGILVQFEIKYYLGSASSEISVTFNAPLRITLIVQRVPPHFPSKPALSPLERQIVQNEI